MKNIFIVFLFLTLGVCCKADDPQLKEFHNSLGKEKSKALNELVKSFQTFLNSNYNQQSPGEKTAVFLQDISQHNFKSWKIDIIHSKIVLENFESSGLRQQIFLYGFEREKNIEERVFLEDDIEEETIPITKDTKTEVVNNDSMIYFNRYGDYIIGLNKYYSQDSIVQQYTEIKLIAGDISPSLVSGGFLEFPHDELEKPIIQTIIAVEFYYFLLNVLINK